VIVRARVTPDPIDPTVLLAQVRSDEDGAIVLFLGVVRDHNQGRAVAGMSYESYGPMAEKVLGQIGAEAAARLGTDRLAVVHRVGELDIGEISVAIAASSPHRAEAFDASRYVIEQIKVRLPMWKQEHYAAGESEWVDGTTPPVPHD
jgi:molybdopterin synthase catalytic subunit